MENVRIFFVCVIWAIVVIGGICIRSLIMMLYWPARVLMACEYYGGVGGDRLFEIIRGGPFNKLLDDELFCGRRSTQPANLGWGTHTYQKGGLSRCSLLVVVQPHCLFGGTSRQALSMLMLPTR